jgi:transposase
VEIGVFDQAGLRTNRDCHRILIMFRHLKDWRRIHTRYDRCAHAFMSTNAVAAVILPWMPVQLFNQA